MHAKSFQSRPALCNHMDRPTRPAVHGILQARIQEWVAMTSSRGFSWPRDGTHVSCGSCIAGRFFTTEPPGKPQRPKLKHNSPVCKQSGLEWSLWYERFRQPLACCCASTATGYCCSCPRCFLPCLHSIQWEGEKGQGNERPLPFFGHGLETADIYLCSHLIGQYLVTWLNWETSAFPAWPHERRGKWTLDINSSLPEVYPIMYFN